MTTPETDNESNLIPVSDQSSEIVDFDDIYEIPVISRLAKNQRPNPSTICEHCPAAVWFALPKKVGCYCRVMHAVIYSNEEKILTACDGRNMVIEQLLAKQAEADAR